MEFRIGIGKIWKLIYGEKRCQGMGSVPVAFPPNLSEPDFKKKTYQDKEINIVIIISPMIQPIG